MKLTRLNDYSWKIEKEGAMQVPVIIYASDILMDKIKLDKSLNQIMNVAQLPGIQKQAMIMPDAHEGYGFPIGGVAAFDLDEGVISPGGIGYDINCGVRLVRTSLEKDKIKKALPELLNLMYTEVPSGVGRAGSLRVNKNTLMDVLHDGAKWAVDNNYGFKKDLERHEDNGKIDVTDLNISDNAMKRGLPQLGSLGSGNHFLEVQYVEEIYDKKAAEAFGIFKGQICVMIHCGSRGLGHQVCSDYIREMERTLGSDLSKLPDRQLVYAPIKSELGERYFNSMSAAANYAWANRQMITHWVRESFSRILKMSPEDLEMDLVYDVTHNIAKMEKHQIDGKTKKVCVHRKGATRSFGPSREEISSIYRKTGQPVIIPGSMGTSSYLLVGTDSAEEASFGSTAHGAGRVMSRSAAINKFTGDQIKKQIESQGILLKTASWKGVVEEAPQVYKDIDEVVNVSNNAGIGKLVAKLKPMGVIKG
ncbi:MAG: RtcB family protein [DPANN group archaeon]|nr:RtcB family protein [DPANN group archaeon]